MRTKRGLERILEEVQGFDHPRIDLEQYPTPATIAAHLVHRADLEGDLEGNTVLDLGTGTGMLALGCAYRSPFQVVGLEVDRDALVIALDNERRLDPPSSIHWILGDATRIPLCPSTPITVLMNPPFGAQRNHVHADRAFLSVAKEIAHVSYSIHNDGSAEFVNAFALDNGGKVTHAFEISFDLAHQYDFHDRERVVIQAELYRIEW